MTFRVLHVCTGNLCRSPMAEHLMRAELAERLGGDAERFVVESAGTRARSGARMPTHALTTLQGRGLDGSAFRAQDLLPEQVAAADLVLAAAREHRGPAVVLAPRQSARSFTLLEFARLAEAVDPAQLPQGDPVERARELVRLAATQRGLVRAARPEDDDIPDPYRGPERLFLEAAGLAERAIRVICARIAG